MDIHIVAATRLIRADRSMLLCALTLMVSFNTT